MSHYLPLRTRLARTLRHPVRVFVFTLSRWCDKQQERWARLEWEPKPGCDRHCPQCGYLCERCGRPL